MATVLVHAPVSGYDGLSAGVSFAAGVAEVDARNASALRYFRRHGYRITPVAVSNVVEAPKPVAEVAAEPVPAPEPVAAEVAATAPTRAKAKRPGKTAGKDAWIAYAVAQGAQETEVRKLTKPQLVGIYGG